MYVLAQDGGGYTTREPRAIHSPKGGALGSRYPLAHRLKDTRSKTLAPDRAFPRFHKAALLIFIFVVQDFLNWEKKKHVMFR